MLMVIEAKVQLHSWERAPPSSNDSAGRAPVLGVTQPEAALRFQAYLGVGHASTPATLWESASVFTEGNTEAQML